MGNSDGSPGTSLEALLIRSGGGDATAFAEMYDRTAGRVLGLAKRILHDSHQSEEVTQEVFLEVWRSAAAFDPARGSGMSWLMMLTHRRAVDRVRDSERLRRCDRVHAERTGQTPYDETASTVAEMLDAGAVRRALAALSDLQRTVLELAYFEGRTHTEIATLLEIPLGTAKTRIRDGLSRIRRTQVGLLTEAV